VNLDGDDLVEPRQIELQDVAEQEQQRRLRLIAGGRQHSAVHREVLQEGGYFCGAQVARVALAVEQDKPAHPVHAAVLGADRVMAHPDRAAQAFKQPGRRRSGSAAGEPVDTYRTRYIADAADVPPTSRAITQ
jgi:hypothetical protein